MKTRITIKHVTLAVGILVALLAAMLFLVNDAVTFESRQAISLPVFSIPKAAPAFIQTIINVLF